MTLDDKIELIPELLQNHDFAAVIETVNEVVAQSATPADVDPGWYVLRGVAHHLSSRPVDAIANYEAALDRDPENVEANISLAYILACWPDVSLHDAQRAIQHAMRGCEVSEWASWNGVQMLAAAYARAEEFAVAAQYIQRAQALAPASQQWRVARLSDCIAKGLPYTLSVEDDMKNVHFDWEQSG